jgi:Domain of Unknown Function (DUF1080)
MRRFWAALIFASAALSVWCAEGRPLFNGRDLSGWETYLAKPPASVDVPGVPRNPSGEYAAPIGVNRNPLATFAVEIVDGQPALHISGALTGGIATLETFSNYHLRAQFKWGPRRPEQKSDQQRNSGLLYHAHGAHGEGNGRWLSSQQFQVQPGNCGDYIAMGPTGAWITAKPVGAKKAVFDPDAAERKFSNASGDLARCSKLGSSEKPEGEWNTLELYCFGAESIHVVNGNVVLRARSFERASSDGETPLTGGRIELQAEGWDIYYRELQIEPIAQLPDRR